MKTIIFLSILICFLGLACQIDAGKSEKTPICPSYKEVEKEKCASMILMYRPACKIDDHCSNDQKCCPDICGQQYCQGRYFDYSIIF